MGRRAWLVEPLAVGAHSRPSASVGHGRARDVPCSFLLNTVHCPRGVPEWLFNCSLMMGRLWEYKVAVY